jgi:ABC-type branched-subunit amino acid transport system substrate-binding protein
VIVTQVVPFPWEATLPVVKSYQSALTAVDRNAKPSFVSLEGYLAGRLVVEALKRIKGEPTREVLLDVIAAAPFDFGGVTLSYGPMKNQGSDRVFFTILQADGTFRPVTRLVKAEGQ